MRLYEARFLSAKVEHSRYGIWPHSQMCCESRLCSAAPLCHLALKPISYPIIFIHRVIFAIFAQNEIAKIALTECRDYRNLDYEESHWSR